MKKSVKKLSVIGLFSFCTFGVQACQLVIMRPQPLHENRIPLKNNPHHATWYNTALLHVLKTKYQVDEKTINEIKDLKIPLVLNPLAIAILQSKTTAVTNLLKKHELPNELGMYFADKNPVVLRTINSYLHAKDSHPKNHLLPLTASQKPSLAAIPE